MLLTGKVSYDKELFNCNTLSYTVSMADLKEVLSLFHPLIGQWFHKRYGEPTQIQRKAWPVIAEGRHLLMTAPTGSGKTLSAFLWGLDQLITGRWDCGSVRILYVSPLRALNNDIRINLLSPLADLREVFQREGEPFPDIGVQTRSGDTPPSMRQRMLRHPPEILITTPESLNLLLSSAGGRNMLPGIATVILDEIHAVASSKRGTHLMTAVERLVPLCGEFQRIALSATIRPMEAMAEFVGGYELVDGQGEGAYRKREVSLVQAEGSKGYEVRVCSPGALVKETLEHPLSRDVWWENLVRMLRERIDRNRSTLLFVNSRRFTEKLTRLINASGEGGERVAYSHHGSLSREIRHLVERKLREGELRAIVATSSLELGIDIGDVDEVILVQAPYSISSALQRVGRSGHGVHQKSRARLYPLFSRDHLHCAVVAREIIDRNIEESRIPSCALDVLAQVIISMTCMESWTADDLYIFIRTSTPYRDLGREQFDLVLQMLAGRYAETRIRELGPRIAVDPITGHIRCREGTLRLLYMAGGTIPDRGYFHLRVQDSGSKIGELDEEFVWERSVGDVFAFGTQHWRIRNIDHQNVEVVPVSGQASMAPFWKADFSGRDFHLSERIGLALERIDGGQRIDDAHPMLVKEFFMDGASATRLIDFLRDQKRATGVGLPHRHQVVAEHIQGLEDRSDSRQIVLHTIWGGRVILPYSVALAQAWEERYGTELRLFHDDDSILISLPAGSEQVGARDILFLVTPDNLEGLLRRRLERTGMFGARFRENAARALLLPKRGFDRRTPLWLSRIRAKKLLQSVQEYEDFPIITETWRTCLRDEFDMDSLVRVLDELSQGTIRVLDAWPITPSPFASDILHWQTHTHMYEDDTPDLAGATRLREEILREVAFSADLRPKLSDGLISYFTARLKRLESGYTPDSALDLYDWIRERILLPAEEVEDLLAAVKGDHGLETGELLDHLHDRVAEVLLPGAAAVGLLALENLPRLLGALFIPGDEGEDGFCDILSEWLRYEGPVTEDRVQALFGIHGARLEGVLETLEEERRIVRDLITEDEEHPEICDSENLERLLRLVRRKRRRPFRALPVSQLPLFLALHQGLVRREGPATVGSGDGMEGGMHGGEVNVDDRIGALRNGLEVLFGYSGMAGSWEGDYFPARVQSYTPDLLDLLLQRSDLLWFGTGRGRLSFCLASDLELFLPRSKERGSAVEHIFPDRNARYGFWDLHRHSGLGTRELAEKLWNLVWKGVVSNDRFESVRMGLENGFTAVEVGPVTLTGRGFRSRFNRWQSSRPLSGSWYVLERSGEPQDLIEEEDMLRDRVRQLLVRYGILFREILQQELPGLRWGDVFKSLRIMELSGEVLAGYFFEGVSGLQFASPEAFRMLQQPLPSDAVFYINATDPASLCGVKLEGLGLPLPRRISSNYLVFHGNKLVLVLGKNGSDVRFYTSLDDPRMQSYLGIFHLLLNRPVIPVPFIRVERINGEPVLESPFQQPLLRFGFTRSYRDLVLRRAYR